MILKTKALVVKQKNERNCIKTLKLITETKRNESRKL